MVSYNILYITTIYRFLFFSHQTWIFKKLIFRCETPPHASDLTGSGAWCVQSTCSFSCPPGRIWITFATPFRRSCSATFCKVFFPPLENVTKSSEKNHRSNKKSRRMVFIKLHLGPSSLVQVFLHVFSMCHLML